LIDLLTFYRGKRNQQARTRKKAIEAKSVLIEEEGELRGYPGDKMNNNNSDEESDSYRSIKKSSKRK